MPTLNVDKLRASSIGAFAGPVAFGVAAIVTATLGFFALGGSGDSPIEEKTEIATLGSFGELNQSGSTPIEPDGLIEPVPTAVLATPEPTATAPPTATPAPTATTAPAPTATAVPPAPAADTQTQQTTTTPATTQETDAQAATAQATVAPEATAVPNDASTDAAPNAGGAADSAPAATPEPTPEPAPTATPEPTAPPAPTATPVPSPPPTPEATGSADLSDYSALEQQMLNRVNQVRASIGAPPLTMINALVQPSRVWAQQMANGVGLVHCGDCVQAPLPDTCRGWGENIGMGPSMEIIQEALEQSPGHYANMTDAGYSQVGIGITTDATGQMWITQTFGMGC